MMAEKAKLFGDDEIHQEILKINDVKKIKALGRKVKSFDESLWDEHKFQIVVDASYLKFKQNYDLKAKMISHKKLHYSYKI